MNSLEKEAERVFADPSPGGRIKGSFHAPSTANRLTLVPTDASCDVVTSWPGSPLDSEPQGAASLTFSVVAAV